jgi:glycosyltransferase involved in cell wall biosynthesis
MMKISAIIPAYNAAPFIGEAIASVQNQTRAVDELIVVDDGSTDDTADLARSLGAKVVSLERNSGEGVARNTGLANAVGDAIAWLDADDYWSPNHIETLKALLEKFPYASVACAAVQRFGLRTEKIEGYAPCDAPGNIFWRAVNDWLHPIIGTLILREALLSIGGFSTDRSASVDYDMWLRLSRNHLFIATPEVTSYWRWHADQQSQSYGTQLAAVYYFRRKFWETEFESGRLEDADRFISIATKRWTSDFDRACMNKDIDVCKEIFDARRHVPGLSIAEVERRRDVLGYLDHDQCFLTKFVCLRCCFSFIITKIILRINLKRYSNTSMS